MEKCLKRTEVSKLQLQTTSYSYNGPIRQLSIMRAVADS